MGKAERKQAQSMAGQNNQQFAAQGEATQKDIWSRLNDPTKSSTNSGAGEFFGSSMGGVGAYDPGTYNKVSGQNERNIESGGFDPESLTTARSHINSNLQGGGYTEEELARLKGGGMDPGQAAYLRSGYRNLIDTGGISDETAGAMRRGAAGSTAAVYNTLGQKLARSQASSGFGGAGGETAQLARQAAISGAEATTGANAKIGELKQHGTIAGLGGLSDYEKAYAAGERESLSGISRGRLESTQQESQLAQAEQQGRLRASQANQDLATGAAEQRIKAAGGLAELYRQDQQYVVSMIDSILRSQQITGQLTTQQAGIIAELSKQPGLYDTILKSISTLGGAAAGVMGGVGTMSSGGGFVGNQTGAR